MLAKCTQCGALYDRRGNAKTCSLACGKTKKAEYDAAYLARPEAKGKKAESQTAYLARPEVKAKRAEYNAAYHARPEVKAKRAEYDAAYFARPEVKAKRAEYLARPEVKAKRAEYMAKYSARPEVKEHVNRQERSRARQQSTARNALRFLAAAQELAQLNNQREQGEPK